MKGSFLKGSLVVCGALFLSSIGLFAADTMQGVDRGLVGLIGMSARNECGEGMVRAQGISQALCVDLYEASPTSACPHQNPQSVLDTEKNLATRDCAAATVPDALPWRYVSLPQAQRLCAAAGKRLPTADEWYRLALGTEERACVTHTNTAAKTGSVDCVSASGVYDMVGNLWEWVDVTVVDNTYDNRSLPGEGYVTSVDTNGVAITTHEQSESLYGDDYFWSKSEGVFGMIRGGFYGSESDAGLYTINASVQTSFASQGVGFRCVEDLTM